MNDPNDIHLTEENDPEIPLCPNCFKQLTPYDRFCPHCNAPIHGTVMLDPIDRYRAYAFEATKGTPGTSRKGILILVFLFTIALPTLLVGMQQLWIALSANGQSEEILQAAAFLLFGLLMMSFVLYATFHLPKEDPSPDDSNDE